MQNRTGVDLSALSAGAVPNQRSGSNAALGGEHRINLSSAVLPTPKKT
ncbi:hypothetical protein [Chromatium okenii]|nr:hypothetical protein [Chromatium okenii]